MIDLGSIDLVAIIGRDVRLKKVAATNGGEYAGHCPFCRDGHDRFRVWGNPREGNPSYWCRVCGSRGTVIDYVAYQHSLYQDGKPDFRAVCELLHIDLNQPTRRAARSVTHSTEELHVNDFRQDYACFDPEWQAAAARWFEYTFDVLDTPSAQPARDWLARRGIGEWSRFPMGFNPVERREKWGSVDVWLPIGITLLWEIGADISNIRIRRRDSDVQAGADKYISIRGAANSIYNIDAVCYGSVVILTEGEFDAMIVRQAITPLLPRHMLTAASIGSVSGGRALRWVTRLSLARRVLLAFDADDAGDRAAEWWLQALGSKAIRLRPEGAKDASDMWKAGIDLTGWIQSCTPIR